MLRLREAHHVVDGEEVALVLHLGDERELVLDLVLHLGRQPLWKAPARAFVGQAAQVARRRLTVRHHLLRVLVAQLVEREGAAGGHLQGLLKQVVRVQLPQRQPGAQVALSIGLKLHAALRQRLADPDRRQRVLQWLARPHVHVHVAGGHQWEARQVRQVTHARQPGGVVDAVRELDRHPGAAFEVMVEPACLRVQRLVGGRAVGHVQHQAVVEPARPEV